MTKNQLLPRYFRTRGSVRLLNHTATGGVGVGFAVDSAPDRRRDRKMMESGRVFSNNVGFNYVLRGTGSVTGWDGQTRQLHPGVFFHFDMGRPYRLIHHGNDFAECWVAVQRHLYEFMLDMNFIPAGCWSRDIGLHLPIIESYEALEKNVNDSRVCNSVFFRRLLSHLELIYESDSEPSAREKIVQRAQVMLDEDLHENPSIPAMAKRLGMSCTHLRRIFHSATGVSPKEYRIKKRLGAACKMLMSKPPKRVAAELGYSSIYYFSKQFKAYTGQSPRAYLQQNRLWRMVP